MNVLTNRHNAVAGSIDLGVHLAESVLNRRRVVWRHHVGDCLGKHSHVRDASGHVLTVKTPVEANTRRVVEDVAMQRRAGDRAEASEIGEVRHLGDVDGGRSAGQVNGHSVPFRW